MPTTELAVNGEQFPEPQPEPQSTPQFELQDAIPKRRTGVLWPAMRELEKVNKELWLVLSLFVVALVFNVIISSQQMVLGFYTLPTVLSAYLYGRRHATLTTFASVLLVIILIYSNLPVFDEMGSGHLGQGWLDIAVWGGTLIVTGYLMGTLYEHKDRQVKELRSTYHGILLILRHFISKDKYTENHSYRVSVYAAKIAANLRLDPERIEDVRAAALLHDIGKLDISRSILYKAARLTEAEFNQIQQHVDKGVHMLEPVGGSLRRILPIIPRPSRQVRRLGGTTRRQVRRFRWRLGSSRCPTSTTRSPVTGRTARRCRLMRCEKSSPKGPARNSTRPWSRPS